MKRILPLLLALCPLVPAAEPPMEPPPSQVLAEVKRATRCKIEYARSAVRPKVIIELPEDRAAQVLALLAQMEPADGKMNGGVDIYFGPNAVFPTIIVTTPEGEELRINVMDIGYSDLTEPRYYRDLFKLPRLLLYRLEALVKPEANHDALCPLVLAKVKRATRCKIKYAGSAVRPQVIIELPEDRAAQVLALLAQMEPADGKRNDGVDIYFAPNAVFPTIIVTTPEGEELHINVMDIGYSDSTEPRYYRDLFKLPRPLLYRLEALVRPEANLDLINH